MEDKEVERVDVEEMMLSLSTSSISAIFMSQYFSVILYSYKKLLGLTFPVSRMKTIK